MYLRYEIYKICFKFKQDDVRGEEVTVYGRLFLLKRDSAQSVQWCIARKVGKQIEDYKANYE